MGIKQHCQSLEKKGYLRTWRIPRTTVGRPEKFYLLTDKGQCLFPEKGSTLLDLLETATQLLGPSGPEKLLYSFYENRRDQLDEVISKKTDTPPLESLLKLLGEEGYYIDTDPKKPEKLLIYHHPWQALFEQFPNAQQMELRNLEKLIHTRLSIEYITTPQGQNLTYWIIN